jgi:hypothetical protein
MALTTRDVLLDADLFRAAQPNWPHPEPLDPGSDAARCTDCGHLPACDCPHFCQPRGT